jgi:hypothetical protein
MIIENMNEGSGDEEYRDQTSLVPSKLHEMELTFIRQNNYIHLMQ